jgi:hypothetical protein
MKDDRDGVTSPGMALRRISGLNIENLRLASGLSMAKDAIAAHQQAKKSQVDAR